MKRNRAKCDAAPEVTGRAAVRGRRMAEAIAGALGAGEVSPTPAPKAAAKAKSKAKPGTAKKAAAKSVAKGKAGAGAKGKAAEKAPAKTPRKRAAGSGGDGQAVKAPTKAGVTAAAELEAAKLKALVDTAEQAGLWDDHGFPAPKHLSEEKQVIWRTVIERMFRLKSLDLEPDLDQDIIEQYVTAIYDFRKANKFIEDNGHSYENAQGNWARYPESTVAKEAQVAIERLGTRLGLNPRARQIMNISRPSEKDAFDDDDD